jgi:hypothetical protein
MEKEEVRKEAGQELKMKREHFDEGLAFVERCHKELGLTVKMVKVNNKNISEEPLLIHKSGRKVAWVCPRANQLFGVYAFFVNKDKEIHKISTQADIEKEFDIIKELVKQIDELPSQKERPSHKRSRKSKKISPTKPRSIFEIEEQIQRLGKKSNAIHIKVVTPEIKRWAESKGYKFVDDGHTLMIRELPDQ